MGINRVRRDRAERLQSKDKGTITQNEAGEEKYITKSGKEKDITDPSKKKAGRGGWIGRMGGQSKFAPPMF
tara:strand:+ start:2018 stop:2230 length:213 start_codon:yes stop_codon:yes gene_type:complete